MMPTWNAKAAKAATSAFNLDLKQEFQAELQDARIQGGGDSSELSRRHIAVGRVEVDIIEDVEELRANLQADPVRDIQDLHQRDVCVEILGPPQHILSGVAKGPDGVRNELRDVKIARHHLPVR